MEDKDDTQAGLLLNILFLGKNPIQKYCASSTCSTLERNIPVIPF
jgi:hypothetical protein